MTVAAVLIFCLTYVLIASHRLRLLPLGRPAGALLGAVMMVACGVLTPRQTFAAIDHDTIQLLFSMMLLTAYLESAGFFEALAYWLLRLCRSPGSLLVAVSLSAAVLAALLVNDTVCLFLTPVVVAIGRRSDLPLGPYLLALATSANVGSAATLVGNPQNMIVGSMSGIPFCQFLLRAGPAAAVGMAANVILLWLYYGRRLPRRLARPAPRIAPPGAKRRLAWTTAVVLGVVVGFFCGLHLGYTTLAGVLLLMIEERRDPRPVFARVDWPLLVFFCSLFIVVHGLAQTGLVERAWEWSAPFLTFDRPQGLAAFSALMSVGSNIVSNVPMVLITGPHLGALGSAELGWVLLAYTTTVAGNLTLIGSVANIIVAEGAREHYTLGFWEYLRFGVSSTILALAGGVGVIYLTAKPL